ncbi:MAG: creatininase family protein [Deltaproteobacteria bacterium]|nr:creatininase family protein [Deltaproteobacteria bacterium]
MALHRAAELTWTEVKKLAPKSVALLPVGSTEAHGPHLPLATDVIIAEAVCARVAERLKARKLETVVFPPLAYGLTEFAKVFAGTVGLSGKEVTNTIRDAALGISQAGFAKMAVVNHHLEPAHFKAVRAGAEAARKEGAKVACPDHRRTPWAPILGPEFTHGGSHAGLYETSLVLAAAPKLVRDDIREALPAVEVDLPAAIKKGATNFHEAGGPDAYFGQPALASAAEGNRLLDVLADATLAALDELDG